MKKWITLLIAGAWLAASGLAAAEVVIKQRPLTWDDVKGHNGEQLYGKLCASCHGLEGKGDGPATPALTQAVPDLTHMPRDQEGLIDHGRIEKIIAGKDRRVRHGVIGMPKWEEQFKYIRTGWNDRERYAFARKRIHELAEHVESLQEVALVD
ncbi:MAG: c-type cytochrome [Lysobacterales bacterium]